jgi:hypothetical protein
MRFFIYIIFIGIGLAGCGNQSLKQSGSTLNKSYRLEVTVASEPKLEQKPSMTFSPPFAISPNNGWVDSSLWGAMGAINIQETRTIAEHPHAHPIFKENAPILCEEYVLWVVTHDGSCWVDSGMAQLIYHMISAGEDKFDEAIAWFKEILAVNSGDSPEDLAIVKSFFDIFELIRAEMDMPYSFYLVSHQNVRNALSTGFRKLLSSYYRQMGENDRANVIATPNEWGYASDFAPLLHHLGLKYAALYCDGNLRPKYTAPTFIFSSFSDYLSFEEGVFGKDESVRATIKKLPDVITFRSKPGYIDIMVKKSFSNYILSKQAMP